MMKRQIPLLIVIVVGLITLFGHFFSNQGIQNFVDNDSTQWYDIIASFAIFLGALNLLKLQLMKIYKKQNNWQYSILAVLGFFFALFAGFLYRGAYTVSLSGVAVENHQEVAGIIATGTHNNVALITAGLEGNDDYTIPMVFMTEGGAEALGEDLSSYGATVISPVQWGAHLTVKLGNSGSLFWWIFNYIFTPLSASMFALLAFFVASASYRAFRIRNFEATLLLSAGIILMLGRVPVGQMISPWFVGFIFILAMGAVIAPMVKNKFITVSIVVAGIAILTVWGVLTGWDSTRPAIFYFPVLQEWIFNVPTTAGARAIMIGIGLGIVGTSFRIIIGLERSFLGEK